MPPFFNDLLGLVKELYFHDMLRIWNLKIASFKESQVWHPEIPLENTRLDDLPDCSYVQSLSLYAVILSSIGSQGL